MVPLFCEEVSVLALQGENSGMINVLHVVDNLSQSSGIATMLMNFYHHVDRKKIRFSFLIFPNKGTSSTPNYISDIKKKDDKVFQIECLINPNSVVKGIVQLFAFFHDHKGEFDIVHLHTPVVAPIVMFAAMRGGINVRILHAHSTMFSSNILKEKFSELMVKFGRKYITDMFACSKEAAYFMFGTDENVYIIHNAIDTRKFLFDVSERQKKRNAIGLNDNHVVVIQVAQFSEIKNHFFLVDVIKNIQENNGDFRFLFVGDGILRKEFERLLEEKRMGKYCCFVGNVSDVNNYLSAADLFILPSLKEGLPVSVIEAQANGLKCILSDTITKECNINAVMYVPLDVNRWIHAIKDTYINSTEERIEANENIANSHFNIYIEAQKMVNVYNTKGKNIYE